MYRQAERKVFPPLKGKIIINYRRCSTKLSRYASVGEEAEMEVFKKAEELAAAILNSDEYQRMIKARETVGEHSAASIMLRDFQNLQTELHRQQMEGVEVTPEQEEQLQNLFGVISINPYIRELIEAEFAFSAMMLQVNDILAQSLDLKEDGEEDEAEGPKLEVPEKRILIPGKDI